MKIQRKTIAAVGALVAASVCLTAGAAFATTSTWTWDSEPGGHTSHFSHSSGSITETTQAGATAYFEDTPVTSPSDQQQYQLQAPNALGYYVSVGNTANTPTGQTASWGTRSANTYLIQLNGFHSSSSGWVWNSGVDWALNATMKYAH